MDGKKWGSLLFLVSMVVFALSLPPMEGNGSYILLEEVKEEYNYFIEQRNEGNLIPIEYSEKVMEKFRAYHGTLKKTTENNICNGIITVHRKNIELINLQNGSEEYLDKEKELKEAIMMLEIRVQEFEGL